MIGRAGTLVFAVLAVALSGVAGADLYLHGSLALSDPAFLGAIAALVAAYAIYGAVVLRDWAEKREADIARKARLAEEQESLRASLEAANARLKAERAHYKTILEAHDSAISHRTPDGRVTYVNTGFCRLFGVRRDDIVGNTIAFESEPQGVHDFSSTVAKLAMGIDRIALDVHLKTARGFCWLAWEDCAIRDSDGELIAVISVGRDVTERVNHEAVLREERKKADDANQAKSRFLATMSHEIRTPMNGVLGMVRLLLDSPLQPDQKTYAEAIRQSGLSLLHLIEGVLDFSKIESGALVLDRDTVALRPLIESTAELLVTRAQTKGIEIATAVDAEVPEFIRIDGMRLRQVLTNLVGNALKFTDSGGVLISAAIERSQMYPTPMLRLSVRDTGVGIPKEKQAQIFEDFVQADQLHARRIEGTGLGLAISKRLVEAMGGAIGVESEEAKGSTFWATLPLDADAVPDAPHLLKGKRIGVVAASDILHDALARQLAAAGAAYVKILPSRITEAHDACDLLLVDVEKQGENFPLVSNLCPPVIALLYPSQRASLPGLSEKRIRGYLMKPVRQASLEKRLADPVDEIHVPAETAPPQTERDTPKGLSILLAEDNSINALLMRELLRRRGHTVQEVASGEAAIAACAQKRFDLVIMDVHMPGTDGIEAARSIRRTETGEGAIPVPIFALTADASETGRVACLEAGMNGFMTKPIDPDGLDVILEHVSSLPPPESPRRRIKSVYG